MFQQEIKSSDHFGKEKFPQELVVAGHTLSEKTSDLVKSMLVYWMKVSNPQESSFFLTSVVKSLDEVARNNNIEGYDNSDLISRLDENNHAIHCAFCEMLAVQHFSFNVDFAYEKFQEVSSNFCEFLKNLDLIIKNFKQYDIFYLPDEAKEEFEKVLKCATHLKNMLFSPVSIPGECNLSELFASSLTISTPQQRIFTSVPISIAHFVAMIIPNIINGINEKVVNDVMEKVSVNEFISVLSENDDDFPSTGLGLLINGLQSYKVAQGRLGTDGCLSYQYEIATPLITLWQGKKSELAERLSLYADLMKELGGGLYIGGDLKEGKLSIDLYYPLNEVKHPVESLFSSDDYSWLDSSHAKQQEFYDRIKFMFFLSHGEHESDKVSYKITMSLFNNYENRRKVLNSLLAIKDISEKIGISDAVIESNVKDSSSENLQVSMVPKGLEGIVFLNPSQKKGLFFNSEALSDFDVQENISKLSSLIKIIRLDMSSDNEVSLEEVRNKLEKIITIVNALNRKSDQKFSLICDCFRNEESIIIAENTGVPIFSFDLKSISDDVKISQKIDVIFEAVSLFRTALNLKGNHPLLEKIDLKEDGSFISEKFFSNLKKLKVVCSDTVTYSILVDLLKAQSDPALFEKIFFKNVSNWLQHYTITRDADGVLRINWEIKPGEN